jgi:hypothetical protein
MALHPRRPAGVVTLRCVQVDSPDRRWATGMIPTHIRRLLDLARAAAIKHRLATVFSLR